MGAILPTTQGIKFIRSSRSWKRGSEGIVPLLRFGGSHHLIKNPKQVFSHDLGHIPFTVSSFEKGLCNVLIFTYVFNSLEG